MRFARRRSSYKDRGRRTRVRRIPQLADAGLLAQVTEDLEPLLAFRGQYEADWVKWREAAPARLPDLLGPFLSPVPLNAEVESSMVDADLI